MIKYYTRCRYIDPTITSIEIDKETDKSVWINGRREAKRSEYRVYHDTWDDAKTFLLNRAESQVNSARYALNQAKGLLGNVKGLKEVE